MGRFVFFATAFISLGVAACSESDTGVADIQGGDGAADTVGILDPDAVIDGQEGDAPGTPDAGVDVNGFDYPCEPLTKQPCVTSCLTVGEQLCLKEWGPCVPPEERCDNCDDDDCDGIVNDGCPPNPICQPVTPTCPVAAITITPLSDLFTGDALQLSASESSSADGPIVRWRWSVQAPAGSSASFTPDASVEAPGFVVDVPGRYLFLLDVWDDKDTQSCVQAQAAVVVQVYPPQDPEVGCADGAREGFLDLHTYTHIAACGGGWSSPGITPASVVPTCGLQGGDDGPNPEGAGCSAPDLCAAGWHICEGWEEVAAKSPTGCAGATPPNAKPKSHFYALRQESTTGSVCGAAGAGHNDVFGCGNLGAGLGPDKHCGPLDRVLASTQPDSCGFNEAEPPLGPWECVGGPGSDLKEGENVTKEGCPGHSCSYDGQPVGSQDKGGVLCCRG